ncbi:MAG: hypothetical protein F4110_10485 [Acidimicrobiaceae bacterium]|nr:hypothetical protein [Acidimicrobiaceae bacterium]MXZ98802.1 hypothetical protein [Acidimicrobiaceae bacterium]MYE77131.1 hypothetical protein [Acidimicrobiaceae bacterium]MYE98218.1 hypothetical protein [Acidimicrobiaceae bacterium]MYH44874.1 hypothetical protein [Acidimicrobiaceae bacterium]
MLNKIRRLFGDPEAAARREQQRAQAAAAAARREWAQDCAALESEIEACRSYEDLADELDPDCPIVTKRGEEVILIGHGAMLVETRRAPKARYGGQSHGLSLRVAKGVYYRPSVHRGTIEAAPEETAVIDGGDGDGVFVATNKRAVFRGSLHTREFRWDKLVSASPELIGRDYAVMMPVENRQRVSGVLVGSDSDADFVLRRIMFGVALHQDRGDAFIARMEAELAELKAAEPPKP